jgi:pimeloyl-ACP methyl ester carboxylesterase
MPVHIIWGAKDPNLGLNVADALQLEIPSSTLTVFPNAHHNLMLDNPAQFAAAIRSAPTGEMRPADCAANALC